MLKQSSSVIQRENMKHNEIDPHLVAQEIWILNLKVTSLEQWNRSAFSCFLNLTRSFWENWGASVVTFSCHLDLDLPISCWFALNKEFPGRKRFKFSYWYKPWLLSWQDSSLDLVTAAHTVNWHESVVTFSCHLDLDLPISCRFALNKEFPGRKGFKFSYWYKLWLLSWQDSSLDLVTAPHTVNWCKSVVTFSCHLDLDLPISCRFALKTTISSTNLSPSNSPMYIL